MRELNWTGTFSLLHFTSLILLPSAPHPLSLIHSPSILLLQSSQLSAAEWHSSVQLSPVRCVSSTLLPSMIHTSIHPSGLLLSLPTWSAPWACHSRSTHIPIHTESPTERTGCAINRRLHLRSQHRVQERSPLTLFLRKEQGHFNHFLTAGEFRISYIHFFV